MDALVPCMKMAEIEFNMDSVQWLLQAGVILTTLHTLQGIVGATGPCENKLLSDQ